MHFAHRVRDRGPRLHGHRRLLVASALAAAIALAGCGDIHDDARPTVVVGATRTRVPHRDRSRAHVPVTTSTLAPEVVTLNRARVLLALAAQSETAAKRNPMPARDAAPAVVSASIGTHTSFHDVMECIKSKESGDYGEHSHVWDGSGAFQIIPSTWRAWSARAGFAGYGYAYLAPPSVQDAVVEYMLANGGAGNWSPRYGDDPCTVGMGG